jgi:hypothetical protein
MTSGGYRQPSKPAVQSGPGPLSQRVDGGSASKQTARYIAGGDYGDAGLLPIQNAAPMAATNMPAPQAVQGNAQPQEQAQASQVTPLTISTQRPDEPVTAGAASGPGPGPEALRLPVMGMQGGGTAQASVKNLATRPDASPQLKQLAAQLGG